MKKITYLIAILSAMTTNLVFAQDIEDVLVTSSILGLSVSQIENPVHILSEADINKSGTKNIGESIDNFIGISSTDFGSMVGQPVIRGLSGPRIKVLENGLINRDVSGIGADHPIDIDLNNIEQVEIVRGPSSLLYSNGAIGGIVNVVDRAITKSDFVDQEIKLGLEHNSVNDGKVHNVSFNDNLQGVNLSFAYKHANFNNFEIPDEAVIHEPGHTEEEKDHMENSDAKTAAFKTGISVVEDWGYFGLSFKNIENVYGIPFHGEHEDPVPGAPAEEEERIESSTDSDTINMKGSYDISGNFINQIDYFYSDTDYSLIESHIGGEHNGEKTIFANDAQEYGAVLDLSNDNFTQKVVVRSMDEDTSILGEEAFMENVQSEEVSLGYYLGKKISNIHLDLGIRRDEVNRKSKFNSTSFDRDIDSTSLVLGLCYELNAVSDLNLTVGSLERAPSSVELFMNGAHAAVQRFEVGNPELKSEESQNIDLAYNFKNEVGFVSINFYQNNINNYIYRQDTGQVDTAGTEPSNLKIANFVQKDAEMEGYEIQFGTSMDFYNGSLDLSIGRDQVEGTFKDGSFVPRMIPARVLYSLSYVEDNLSVDVDLTNVKQQSDIGGVGDSVTAGFELLDLSIGRTIPVNGVEEFKVIFFANNLLDEVARNHSSTVKNEVPLPGKNLGVKLALQF
jgi:iron complex outermembrane receptor protein|tara:strand:+ start:517 stop:2550 length:2034 start_codon:yes stop_codon:yes gene_type:complete